MIGLRCVSVRTSRCALLSSRPTQQWSGHPPVVRNRHCDLTEAKPVTAISLASSTIGKQSVDVRVGPAAENGRSRHRMRLILGPKSHVREGRRRNAAAAAGVSLGRQVCRWPAHIVRLCGASEAVQSLKCPVVMRTRPYGRSCKSPFLCD
jgi:hypothetical protein